MKKYIHSVSMIFIVLFCVSGNAYSWRAENHEQISENAISISELEQYCEKNLSFSFASKKFQGPEHTGEYALTIDQFSDDKIYTVTGWIKHGSGAEDEFFNRSTHVVRYHGDMKPVNHFYNPFWNNSGIYPYPDDGWGNDWLYQQGGLYDDLFNDIPPLPFDISMGKPLPRWAYNGCPETPPYSDFTRSDDNYFSWIYARKYFYAALSGDSTELDGIGGIEGKINMNESERDRCFALLFRAIGQLMHLVQDAGQPEHTRNDGHPLNRYSDIFPFFEGFEYYASKLNFNDSSWATVIPWNLIIKTENPDNPIHDFFASDHTGSADYSTDHSTGIAEFSSYNFLTKDSIADNLMHDYCAPNCEPHGHERHRFFTHPRINENSSTLEKGFLYDTHYYWSEPISDPLGIFPSQSVRIAKRKWYHNLLLLYGWRDYTTEDPMIWDDYLDILIPRCIGYSAALLDYFFRGTIEITAPDEFVYSIVDGTNTDIINDDEHQIFTHIKAKVKNTTPKEVDENGEVLTYDEMQNGTVLAVAKYKIMENYEKDLSNYPLDANELKTMMEEVNFSYSVSQVIDIESLSSEEATQLTFDFTSNPIPCGITDLYLFVIFKGDLGNEKDVAIAVGMKDLSEPLHYTFWNSSDQVEDPDNPGSLIDNASPFVRDYVVAFTGENPDPDNDFDSGNLAYNYDIWEHLTPSFVSEDLEPGRYFKVIFLVEQPEEPEEPEDAIYMVTDHGALRCLEPAFYQRSDPAANQERSDGEYDFISLRPSDYVHRGVRQHRLFYWYDCAEGIDECSYLEEERSVPSLPPFETIIKFPDLITITGDEPDYEPPQCAGW